MMNVCFLLGGFEGRGGIGRVTSTTINSFSDKDNINVLAVSYVKEKNDSYKTNENIKRDFLYNDRTSMTKAILFRNGALKLRKILKKNQIDILIACGVMYLPLAFLSALGTDIKVMYVEHTNPDIGYDFRFEKAIRTFSAVLSDRIIVISDAARKWYINKGINKNKIRLIYNSIPEEAFSNRDYNPDSTKIISVGRLSFPKNFEGLIDIASRFIKKYPNWIWDIYGDGECKEALEEQIKKNGLEEQVFLRGNRQNIIEIYKDYAFIAMTSRYEGFPMALIEAAANKLPLLSYDIKTGPNEIIIDKENGYLIEFEDALEFSKKIEDLIDNPDKRKQMSSKSYQTSQSFHVERIKKCWLELFHEVNDRKT